ncbi:hypothetical protein QTN25_001395 [Entamoeba marina]
MKSNYLPKDITSIIIPSSVTKLGDYLFKNYVELKSIAIPTTVKHIGKHLIDGCISLTKFNYEGDWNDVIVSYSDYLRYNRNGLLFNSIEYTNDDKIKYGNVIPSVIHSLHHSFYERSNELFHIPAHITSLDNRMFSFIYNHFDVDACPKLQNITIPTSIKTIPNINWDGLF